MKHKPTIKSSVSWLIRFRKLWQLLQNITLGLGLILLVWLISTTITLVSASSQPVDALFVLGGSIRREIYVAQLAKQFPQTPILISQGSPEPCIRIIFQREAADLQDLQKVWLENCANSTFENFYYSLPILQRWGVHKVKLITSGSHVLRSKLMAKIIFGSHGIWIEPEVPKEIGVPGNQEYWLKTALDVTRSLLWTIPSQFIQPQCSQVTKLIDVDMQTWQKRGFKCENQGKLGKYS